MSDPKLRVLLFKALDIALLNDYDKSKDDPEEVAVDVMDLDAEVEEYCKANAIESTEVTILVRQWQKMVRNEL